MSVLEREFYMYPPAMGWDEITQGKNLEQTLEPKC